MMMRKALQGRPICIARRLRLGSGWPSDAVFLFSPIDLTRIVQDSSDNTRYLTAQYWYSTAHKPVSAAADGCLLVSFISCKRGAKCQIFISMLEVNAFVVKVTIPHYT